MIGPGDVAVVRVGAIEKKIGDVERVAQRGGDRGQSHSGSGRDVVDRCDRRVGVERDARAGVGGEHDAREK